MATPHTVEEVFRDLKERYLECLVCMQEYDEQDKVPRILPCYHTYCTSCLKNLLQYDNIKCPQCNKEHCIESHDIANALPKDNTRRDLNDFLNDHQQTKYQTCFMCTVKKPANLYCNDCESYFCIVCFKLQHTQSRQILHNFTEVCHQGIVPNTYKICQLPEHENSSLKYVDTSQNSNKLVCATCILTENKELLSHSVKTAVEVTAQRKLTFEEDLEKLQTIETSIRSEIENVEFFFEFVNSQTKWLKNKTNDLFAKTKKVHLPNSRKYKGRESKTSVSKYELIKEIQKASAKDQTTLHKALNALEEQSSRINECSHFINQISKIDDSMIFNELYGFIKGKVNKLCNITVKSFRHDAISALDDCKLLIEDIEMSKHHKEETMTHKTDTVEQNSTETMTTDDPRTYMRYLGMFWKIFTWIVSLPIQINWSLILTNLLHNSVTFMFLFFPATVFTWYHGTEFPDITFKTPALHPSLQVSNNNSTLSFSPNGFRMFPGTTANISIGAESSYRFTMQLSYFISGTIDEKNLFTIAFAKLNDSHLDSTIHQSENVWSLFGFLCKNNKNVCIGKHKGSDIYLKILGVLSSAEQGTIFTEEIQIQLDSFKRQIRFRVINLQEIWVFSNVDFSERLFPLFGIYASNNIHISMKLLTKELIYDEDVAHPRCLISKDKKVLKTSDALYLSLETINVPIENISNSLTNLKYTGALADMQIYPLSNIFYVIDIDYTSEKQFHPPNPLFEIGLFHANDMHNNVSVLKSIIGHSCTSFLSPCFKPKHCNYCRGTLQSNRIFIHIIHDSVTFYNFPWMQKLIFYRINFPTIPFVAIFVPERQIKLTIRSGNSVRLYELMLRNISEMVHLYILPYITLLGETFQSY